MASSVRASSCPSQAKLLRSRGELHGKRAAFKVNLSKPCPLALQFENAFDRIGLDLRRGEVPGRLLVADVDKNPRRKTPVARWNTEEERNSKRGDGERQASFALLPGDRLRAINDVNGETAMLTELVVSMSPSTPRAVDLCISRNIADVMEPSPNQALPATPSHSQPITFSDAATPSRLPRLHKEACSPPSPSPCTASPGERARSGHGPRAASAGFVRTPPRSMHRSLSGTRAVSAPSSRSRSGSRRCSMQGPCSSALGLGVSLSHAGRVALVF